jgi:hypothetical protein
MKQLSQLANSKQGKELLDKAKTFANDPKTREKIEDARGKFNEHVETAKQKIAEKKAHDAAAHGADAAASPAHGEDAKADAPTYGEPAADPPTYGEGDGPKAA